MEVHIRWSDRKRRFATPYQAIQAIGQDSSQPSLYAQASTRANLGYITLRTFATASLTPIQTFDNLGYYLPAQDIEALATTRVLNTNLADSYHLPRLAIKHSHPQIFTRSSPNYFKTY